MVQVEGELWCEACSAEDLEQLAYIEEELLDSVFGWDIEEGVNDAMEVVNGTVQEVYEQIANGQVIVTNPAWENRLETIGNNVGKELSKASLKWASKKVASKVWKRAEAVACVSLKNQKRFFFGS